MEVVNDGLEVWEFSESWWLSGSAVYGVLAGESVDEILTNNHSVS